MFAGESVMRRLDRLAQAVGLEAAAEPDLATARRNDPEGAAPAKRRPCATSCCRRMSHYVARDRQAARRRCSTTTRRGSPPDQVWVLEDAGRDRRRAGAGGQVRRCFLLDNIAVRPDRQGAGYRPAAAGFRRGGGASGAAGTTITLYTNALMVENIAMYAARGYVETGAAAREGVRPGVHGEAAGFGSSTAEPVTPIWVSGRCRSPGNSRNCRAQCAAGSASAAAACRPAR